MNFATERELTLTRELLQARLANCQQLMQIAQIQAGQLQAQLAALPQKWEAPTEAAES